MKMKYSIIIYTKYKDVKYIVSLLRYVVMGDWYIYILNAKVGQ